MKENYEHKNDYNIYKDNFINNIRINNTKNSFNINKLYSIYSII